MKNKSSLSVFTPRAVPFPDWVVDFPLKGPHSLGGEVYVLHQLEGEEEPIQVDFIDYMDDSDYDPFEEG